MNAAITGSLACCDTVAKGAVAHARTQVIAWLADLGIRVTPPIKWTASGDKWYVCYSTSTKIAAMEILIPVQEDRKYRDCLTDDDCRKSCSVYLV